MPSYRLVFDRLLSVVVEPLPVVEALPCLRRATCGWLAPSADASMPSCACWVGGAGAGPWREGRSAGLGWLGGSAYATTSGAVGKTATGRCECLLTRCVNCSYGLSTPLGQQMRHSEGSPPGSVPGKECRL